MFALSEPEASQPVSSCLSRPPLERPRQPARVGDCRLLLRYAVTEWQPVLRPRAGLRLLTGKSTDEGTAYRRYRKRTGWRPERRIEIAASIEEREELVPAWRPTGRRLHERAARRVFCAYDRGSGLTDVGSRDLLRPQRRRAHRLPSVRRGRRAACESPTGTRFLPPPIEPCMRFSRTRLTDVLRRWHSASPARACSPWARRRSRRE
jgi:hypothetical protein